MRLRLFLAGLVFTLANIAWAAPTPAKIFGRAVCIVSGEGQDCSQVPVEGYSLRHIILPPSVLDPMGLPALTKAPFHEN
jgi:hypothetical protein